MTRQSSVSFYALCKSTCVLNSGTQNVVLSSGILTNIPNPQLHLVFWHHQWRPSLCSPVLWDPLLCPILWNSQLLLCTLQHIITLFNLVPLILTCPWSLHCILYYGALHEVRYPRTINCVLYSILELSMVSFTLKQSMHPLFCNLNCVLYRGTINIVLDFGTLNCVLYSQLCLILWNPKLRS